MVSNKQILFAALLLLSFILAACSAPVEIVGEPVTEQEVVEETSEPIVEEVAAPVVEEPLGCVTKSDCEWNEHCIEGACGTLTTVYDTEGECTAKCNFNQVQIRTSDGDDFELVRGKGDYTLAGAIEWQLMSSADYCPNEDDTAVAIKLKKKNYGEILEEQVIVVEQGATSDIITHPVIEGSSFTLEILSINEECSV